MRTVLTEPDLTPLALGGQLLGAGGGGAARIVELSLRRRRAWPVPLVDVEGLDPATPCMAGAFIGSTMIQAERLPGEDPFGPLAAAVERWLGTDIPAVCSFEGGGMNNLVPLLFAPGRTVVDADLSGRAVPRLDQFSLFVDQVPGLVLACDAGAGGVALVQTDRGADAEGILRSATVQAGGVGAAVVGGFTVGDLREHAVVGHLSHALNLGRAFTGHGRSPLPELAAALGGELLGSGRIVDVVQDERDPHVHTAELATSDGGVCRVVSRSEILAFVHDGGTVAASPIVIFALDTLTRQSLEVTDLTLNRHISVFSLPAPAWWEPAHRRAAIAPSAYGIAGLDEDYREAAR